MAGSAGAAAAAGDGADAARFEMSSDGSAMIVILLALPVYYGIFCWLFELSFVEALWATFFIGLVQKVVNTVVTLVLAGIFMKVAAHGP